MSVQIKPALESEQIILGAIFHDQGNLKVINRILCSEDFQITVHKFIYQAILDAHKENKPISHKIVSKTAKVDEEYLLNLMNLCVSFKNIEAHASIVREKSVQVALADCIKELHQTDNEDIDCPQ